LVGGLGSAVVASAGRAVAGRFFEWERTGFAGRVAGLFDFSSSRAISGALLDDRRVETDVLWCWVPFSTSVAGDLVCLKRRSAGDGNGGRVSVRLAVMIAGCGLHLQDDVSKVAMDKACSLKHVGGKAMRDR